ncbi:MAG TPA: DUF938 domain-containing protein [Myxococcota bacterium]|nr:DUF938 domain-containing protein [Myxococcota bacterium]
MSKRDAPATHRNREPILEALARWLEGPARVLEIASGTGQHAVFFARHLPRVRWQPSEADPAGLASIAAWIDESALENVAPPLALDVRDEVWPVEPGLDAIFNANLIHIAPWEVTLALLAGAGRVLRDRGLLLLYGPFRVGGEHTAPSNAAFDADLRRRDPSWGVRDREAVEAAARERGLRKIADESLPANNRLLVFRLEGSEAG